MPISLERPTCKIISFFPIVLRLCSINCQRVNYMIGYRDKDGFHIVLEDDEGLTLIPLIGEGVRAVREWNPKVVGETLHAEAVAEAEDFQRKLGTIFVADNYREGRSSPENPIIARTIREK